MSQIRQIVPNELFDSSKIFQLIRQYPKASDDDKDSSNSEEEEEKTDDVIEQADEITTKNNQLLTNLEIDNHRERQINRLDLFVEKYIENLNNNRIKVINEIKKQNNTDFYVSFSTESPHISHRKEENPALTLNSKVHLIKQTEKKKWIPLQVFVFTERPVYCSETGKMLNKFLKENYVCTKKSSAYITKTSLTLIEHDYELNGEIQTPLFIADDRIRKHCAYYCKKKNLFIFHNKTDKHMSMCDQQPSKDNKNKLVWSEIKFSSDRWNTDVLDFAKNSVLFNFGILDISLDEVSINQLIDISIGGNMLNRYQHNYNNFIYKLYVIEPLKIYYITEQPIPNIKQIQRNKEPLIKLYKITIVPYRTLFYENQPQSKTKQLFVNEYDIYAVLHLDDNSLFVLANQEAEDYDSTEKEEEEPTTNNIKTKSIISIKNNTIEPISFTTIDVENKRKLWHFKSKIYSLTRHNKIFEFDSNEPTNSKIYYLKIDESLGEIKIIKQLDDMLVLSDGESSFVYDDFKTNPTNYNLVYKVESERPKKNLETNEKTTKEIKIIDIEIIDLEHIYIKKGAPGRYECATIFNKI